MAYVLTVEVGDGVSVRDRATIDVLDLETNAEDSLALKVTTDLPVFVGAEGEKGFQEFDLEYLVLRSGEQLTIGTNPTEVRAVVNRTPDRKARFIFLQTASRGTAYTERLSTIAALAEDSLRKRMSRQQV